MKIDSDSSDSVILEEIGKRLARTRLEQNVSQQALAAEAGVSKATVERMEAGEPVRSTSLVRVLRVLGLLDTLDRLVPEPLPRPVERLRLQGRRRLRAGSPRGAHEERKAGPWRWAGEQDEDGSA